MSTYTHDNASAPNAQPVAASYGQVAAKQIVNQGGEGVGPATWSTAPYKRRRRDNPNKLLCQVEGCKGFATKTWPGLCSGHGRWGVKDDGNAG